MDCDVVFELFKVELVEWLIYEDVGLMDDEKMRRWAGAGT